VSFAVKILETTSAGRLVLMTARGSV